MLLRSFKVVTATQIPWLFGHDSQNILAKSTCVLTNRMLTAKPFNQLSFNTIQIASERKLMSNPFLQSMTNASTLNGGATHASSLSACVDFSSNWSDAWRGCQTIYSAFESAFNEDQKLLCELFLGSRCSRGAGGVVLFESVCGALPLSRLFRKSSRWFPFWVAGMMFCICSTLLLRLWLWRLFPPRSLLVMHSALSGCLAKSPLSVWSLVLSSFMGLSPAYRKMISRLTSVVESQMCAGDWDGINYSHVPSQAMLLQGSFQASLSWGLGYLLGGSLPEPRRWMLRLFILTRFLLLILLNPLTLLPGTPAAMSDVGKIPHIVEYQWLLCLTGWWIIPPNSSSCGSSGSMLGSYNGDFSDRLMFRFLSGFTLRRNNGPFANHMITFSSPQDAEDWRQQPSRASFFCLFASGVSPRRLQEPLRQSFIMQRHPVRLGICLTILILSDMGSMLALGLTRLLCIYPSQYKAGFHLTIVFWNLAARQGNVPVRFDEELLLSWFSPSSESLLREGEFSEGTYWVL